jgi:magnesium transporter
MNAAGHNGFQATEALGTAAWHASSGVPVAAPEELVDTVLAAMRGQVYDSATVVAVCRTDILVGLAT